MHLNIHFPTRYCGEKYEYPTGDVSQWKFTSNEISSTGASQVEVEGWGILRRYEQKLSVLVGSGVVGGRERGLKSNLWNAIET